MSLKHIIKGNKENSDTMTQTGSWLRRIGMDVLVHAIAMLSDEYGMKWAASWPNHLDDPKWLNRAMVNTFGRLRDADKAVVNPLYEDWLWYSECFDLEATVALGYVAEVYLLDRNRNRISAEGRYQTILVSLDGASREEALCQLNRDTYEFVRWWN